MTTPLRKICGADALPEASHWRRYMTMNTSGAIHQGLTWASRLAPLVAIGLVLPFCSSEGKAQEHRFGEARTAQGRLQSFTTAPMGEVDGAVLDDGTVIHWPPHLANRFTA